MKNKYLVIFLLLLSSLIIFGCKQQAKPKDEGTKQRKAADSATPPPASGAQPKAYGQKTPEPAAQPAATPAEDPAQKLAGTWCAQDIKSPELVRSAKEGTCVNGETILVSIVYKNKSFDGSKMVVTGKGESPSTVLFDSTTAATTITPTSPEKVGIKEFKGAYKDNKITGVFSPLAAVPPPDETANLKGTWCAKDTNESKETKLIQAKEGKCAESDTITATIAYKKTDDPAKSFEGSVLLVKDKGNSAVAVVYDGTTAKITITPTDPNNKTGIKKFDGVWDKKTEIKGTFTPQGTTTDNKATLDFTKLTGKWCAKDKKTGAFQFSESGDCKDDAVVLEMTVEKDEKNNTCKVTESKYAEKDKEGTAQVKPVVVSCGAIQTEGDKHYTTIKVESKPVEGKATVVYYQDGKWSGGKTIDGGKFNEQPGAPAQPATK